jgi:hypothetical protein
MPPLCSHGTQISRGPGSSGVKVGHYKSIGVERWVVSLKRAAGKSGAVPPARDAGSGRPSSGQEVGEWWPGRWRRQAGSGALVACGRRQQGG